MNAPERTAFLPDVQATEDQRKLAIDAVGVKGVRYPVTLRAGKRLLPTIATLSMAVGLPATARGTHMSRFIEMLEAEKEALDQAGFKAFLFAMLQRLDAPSGELEMRFPYFVRKSAPVSGVQSLLDYEVRWLGTVAEDRQYGFWMYVTVPATSLCPCSKEIAAYGAHNQRSHICVGVRLAEEMAVEELIAIAERNASCEVYGLLKRADEKYVTEQAYDNPRFVEDLVRDVVLALGSDARVMEFEVEAENFESIHNHSAFARITHPGHVRLTRR
ncbi:GTP cyclohydrolase FolE2 [Cupriavidus sp. TA19]|uniref:GTP cyclohydrolase FolE2 n=1 Tax=unclassified Cupriavidus TaxID=2640874 RepID=UPI000E2EF020|nr:MULTISPECIES: GTP cyclohydrolase FolE2 [unclassified Cupriavidus]BDB29730.1 GTP cyclohydrolase I FolE2 [Cupriavidus sp. P-10]GLC94424.1 GTP cyclohydrolase FolE2 [Cupriavidus sp. TA19]